MINYDSPHSLRENPFLLEFYPLLASWQRQMHLLVGLYAVERMFPFLVRFAQASGMNLEHIKGALDELWSSLPSDAVSADRAMNIQGELLHIPFEEFEPSASLDDAVDAAGCFVTTTMILYGSNSSGLALHALGKLVDRVIQRVNNSPDYVEEEILSSQAWQEAMRARPEMCILLDQIRSFIASLQSHPISKEYVLTLREHARRSPEEDIS